MNPKTCLRGAWIALLALLPLAPAASAAPAQSGPVKLVVIVSVDGLSWTRLTGYRDWYEAGLERLLTESQLQVNANYGHLNTETCPGHASLGTGAPPRVHGITANQWFEMKPDGTGLRRLYCTNQPGPSGTIAGPANLRVPTFADRLVEASPDSRVVAFSGKDRGAIFLAGKNPKHAVYWYDKQTGGYVSSAAYDSQEPAARDLVNRFNQQWAGVYFMGRTGTVWSPLPMPANAAGLPQPELNIGRFQTPDIGVGFDHDLARHPSGYFTAIYNSPFQDQLLADLALTALADPGLALGRRGVTDVLALSFSANDVISHNYGSESAETLDTLRRLDRELGRVLLALDDLAAAEPKGQVVLALSADHGFTPLPEVTRRKSGNRVGGRLMSPDSLAETPYPNIQERLNRAIVEELCLPSEFSAIFGIEGWTVAYDRKAFPRKRIAGPCGKAGKDVTLADLDRVFPKVVQRLYGEEVEKVLLISRMAQWPAGDKAADFARNDFDAPRSGDAFLIPKDNVLMHWDPVRGSGHGSHHEYDTHVPLLFWGGPFQPGERAEPAAPYDLAPTLADLLGIKLPEATGMSRLRR